MTMITRLVGSLYTKLGIEITGLDSPRLANCSHHDNVNDDDHSTGHPRKAENQSAVINWKMIFERCQIFPHASKELLDNTSLLWNTLGSKSGRLESSADNCQSSCRLSVHKNHTCPGRTTTRIRKEQHENVQVVFLCRLLPRRKKMGSLLQPIPSTFASSFGMRLPMPWNMVVSLDNTT